ncbi:hypothetical protein J4U02_gp047 [Mycobacterium phage Aziz]|uniref:Uncharacterized protein n=1 Tax=Mycobacterium phage Aziz TaxID=2762281 RepID=A0A7G8LHI5_9CAUD|nr:hypothetical protein J4U02_gp047 [Mycobacterium phage Aziz]ASR75894.1 hypothetical protein SEA_GENEVAB15_47 [Mycobacterium phage GenevaB15]QNJ56707.1 hypothetical protein SEA_AZIZ_47 [Mycobacterium phage Aziz]
MSLQEQLADAQKEVRRLERLIDAEDLPVGTIVQPGGGYGAFIRRYRSIHDMYDGLPFPTSKRPRWVVQHDDFSGKDYATLAEAMEKGFPGQDFTIIHQPSIPF